MTLPLNGYLALALIAAVPLAPLWLPLLPLVIWWWRRETRIGRELGYAALPRFAAEAIAAHAEAAFGVAPEGGWTVVARNVDRYLNAVDSPRHWRTFGVLTILAFAPWLRLQPRLAALPLPRRRRFLERHLRTTRGFLLVPSLARQLVRMGYYHDRGIAAALGFRTVNQRRQEPARAAASAASGAKVAG
ncbi:MAG: hypothetical protein H6838_14035 [Planctomycetes bacterium]|nr:hypothetical protein [Planctomycetota bacterium]MCB9886609.1 hypothetical protein [Planctomycetota bacterium]